NFTGAAPQPPRPEPARGRHHPLSYLYRRRDGPGGPDPHAATVSRLEHLPRLPEGLPGRHARRVATRAVRCKVLVRHGAVRQPVRIPHHRLSEPTLARPVRL